MHQFLYLFSSGYYIIREVPLHLLEHWALPWSVFAIYLISFSILNECILAHHFSILCRLFCCQLLYFTDMASPQALSSGLFFFSFISSWFSFDLFVLCSIFFSTILVNVWVVNHYICLLFLKSSRAICCFCYKCTISLSHVFSFCWYCFPHLIVARTCFLFQVRILCIVCDLFSLPVFWRWFCVSSELQLYFRFY